MIDRSQGRRCGDCLHYQDSQCHAHPPRTEFSRDGLTWVTIWLAMEHDDWCGEFSADLDYQKEKPRPIL